MSAGFFEILLIAGIILLFFGAKKLPELGKAAREGLDNFKKKDDEVSDTEKIESTDGIKEEEDKA